MKEWVCSLCKCDGFRCTCVGGRKIQIYVCKSCTFQSTGRDKECRNCGHKNLVNRDTGEDVK